LLKQQYFGITKNELKLRFIPYNLSYLFLWQFKDVRLLLTSSILMNIDYIFALVI